MVSFDADEPGEFLDLVQELRGTESSAYTESETPIFTCISASVERALDALDGEVDCDRDTHMSANGNHPTLQNDTEIRDITVIGAGPVGLITAFWAGMREASSRVIDSLPEIGGQLTTLYPEKWIFDVPGLHAGSGQGPGGGAAQAVDRAVRGAGAPRDDRRARGVRARPGRSRQADHAAGDRPGRPAHAHDRDRRRPRRFRAEEAPGLRHRRRGRARAPTTSSARSRRSPASG